MTTEFDTVTVLTTTGQMIATKRWSLGADGTPVATGYQGAKRFRWRTERVSGLGDIFRLLTGLASRHQDLVIRGEPRAGVKPGELVERRIHARAGVPGDFVPADPGRHWVTFDFDGLRPDVALGTHPSDEDLRGVAEQARHTLGEGFRSTSCVYRYSSSAGVLGWDEVSLHLWFWLHAPVCDRSIKEWARGRIDSSLYNPVQPHFTADPVFDDGVSDPFAGRARIGILPGADEIAVAPADWVDLPTYRSEQDRRAAEMEASRPIPVEIPTSGDVTQIEDARRRYAAKALEKACSEIQAQGKGARHDTMVRETWAMGGYVGAGYLPFETAASALGDAISSVVPRDRAAKERDSVREVLTLGAEHPRALDHIGKPRLALVPPTIGDNATPAQGIRAALALPPSEDEKMARFCGGLLDDGEGGKRPVHVEQVAKGAPVEGHIVPHGYWLHGGAVGVWKVSPQGVYKYPLIEHTPIVVVATEEDIETGRQRIRVAWKVGERWEARWLPREDALTRRGLEKHIGLGFPVTSESSGQVVGFLKAYLAANATKIPSLVVSSVFGWQGNRGARGFLAGRMHIMPDGRYHTVDLERQATWGKGSIGFSAAADDLGGGQIANALVMRGSLQDWAAAVRRLDPYPRVVVGILASLSAPLLEFFGASNYLVDWAFRTSSGKTTILSVAASVWGDPDPSAGFIRPWSATSTAIERTAVTLRSLPLILDDTAQARFPDLVSQAIYDLAKGQSKPRGSKTGTEAVASFKLSVLSTGEQPATSFGSKGGAKARTLEIVQAPFGDESPETARIIKEVRGVLADNHGIAGPRLVAWILSRPTHWQGWRERFAARAKSIAGRATDGASSRMAETRAVLELTHELAEEALGIGLSERLEEVWQGIAAESADAAGEERARDLVASWFARQRKRFLGTRGADPGTQGWLGSVVTHKNANKKYVAFDEAELGRELERSGYSPKAILNGWKSRGWLFTDEGRLTRKASLSAGVRIRAVCLPMDFFMGTIEANDAAPGEGEVE